MSVSISSNEIKVGNLRYFSDENLISIVDEKFTLESQDKKHFFAEDNRSFKILSSQPKILIKVHQNPLHNVINTYGTILNCLNIFENPLFIFNTYNLRPGYLNHNLIEFFYCFLKDNNINRMFLDPALHSQILIDNFYFAMQSDDQPVPNPINKINEKFLDYVDRDYEPFRKVYVSRKNIVPKTYEFEKKQDLLKDFKERLSDEYILEKYFQDKNFEIVYPENFNSFIEQINYFSEVKTLISLSGASAMNGIFMKPKTNILEISTELVTPHNSREHGGFIRAQHHFFHNISYERDIYFYSIKNDTKKSEDIINKIESNKFLKELVNE